ncbi:hypothetical protein P7H20_26595 [Paenibacillus larvae]|nr:hypothetical protein [Paenibacillus larvae]MDT2277697.1 hypothetical protein [Paenibacillus larvae]
MPKKPFMSIAERHAEGRYNKELRGFLAVTKLYEVQEAVYRRLTSDTALMPMIKGVAADHAPENVAALCDVFSCVFGTFRKPKQAQ